MIQPENSFEAAITQVERLERAGFNSIWLADHLVNLKRYDRCLDPWPIIAALTHHTSKITFGSMVTDPFRRHPAVFAQTLSTVDWLTRGRLVLGIGAGEAMNVVPFNIPWDRRVRKLIEFVKILRLLWSGEAVDFCGEFKLDRAFIQALPFKRAAIPIYIAANSPFTRKVVGRLGNGWITEMLSPTLYRDDLKEVQQAAVKAGRGIKDIEVVYHVFCCISKDGEDAKSLANEMARLQFTWWPKQLARYGVKISEHCDWNRIVVDENSYRQSKELSRVVPEEIADAVTISGEVDECIDKIEEYIAAGVSHFGMSIPGNHEETLHALEKRIIPYFKDPLQDTRVRDSLTSIT